MNYTSDAFEASKAHRQSMSVGAIDNIAADVIVSDISGTVLATNPTSVKSSTSNLADINTAINTSMDTSDITTDITAEINAAAVPEAFAPFPYHNPFDINSYPITNPPIFDSTMNLPDLHNGSNRRRRISISNGQISQIVNHEAIFDYDDAEQFAQFQLPQPQSLQLHVPVSEFQPPNTTASVTSTTTANTTDSGVNFIFQASQSSQSPSILPPPPAINPSPSQSQPQSHSQPAQRQPPQPQIKEDATVSSLANELSNVVAGVPPPNHQLIYNDEIIFNPNNGPIPGTAAWKKERLLERNRVAASKCRQRKKQAQLQLQDNVNKIERESKQKTEKINKLTQMLTLYNALLKSYFETKDPEALTKLKSYVELTEIEFAEPEI